MKRGFRSSAVTPVGITIAVCARIVEELLAFDQICLFIVLNKILFCDCRAVV